MFLAKDGVTELEARLADRTLGIQALRVLLAMIEGVNWDNRVDPPQKELARRLRMTPGEVSKASQKLLACGFIERMSDRRGWYRISPGLLWMGSVEGLHQRRRGPREEPQPVA